MNEDLIKQEAKELYPFQYGHDLDNYNPSYAFYNAKQKEKQSAYITAATRYSKRIEEKEKEIEGLKSEIKQVVSAAEFGSYWKSRCEAAEVVIEKFALIPPHKNATDEGKEVFNKWLQLKQKSI